MLLGLWYDNHITEHAGYSFMIQKEGCFAALYLLQKAIATRIRA